MTPGGLSAQSINPYEPATSLPGVPRTGGGATQTDMLMSMLQRNSANEQARYYLMADARGRAVTAMAMKALGGSNAKTWMNSDEGRLVNLAFSTMLNGEMGAAFGSGGNILGLAAGLGNIAGSNMNLGEMGSFAGRGAVSDQVTRSLFDRVNEDFYNKMGAENLHRTHGMDRDQMGEIATRLAQSGAFAGLKAGDLVQSKKGLFDFKPDEETFKKITNLTSDTAGLVRRMQDITGSQDVAKNMQLASTVSGISMSDPNAVREIEAKVRHIVNTSSALGLNPGTLMSSMAHRGGGPFAETAVMNTAQVMANNQVARNAAAKNGVYMPELDRNRMEDISQAGITAAALQEREVTGAAWLLGSSAAKGHEDEIRGAMMAVGKAGSRDDRAKAVADLIGVGQKYSDIPLAAIAEREGGAAGVIKQLKPGDRNFFARVASAADQSEGISRNIDQISAASDYDQRQGLGYGTTAGLFRQMLNTVTSDKREDFMYALANGGKIDDFVVGPNKAGVVQDFQKAAAAATGGRAGLAGVLGDFNRTFSANPMTAGLMGDADTEAMKNKEFVAKLNAVAFGTGTPESQNPIAMAIRGMAEGQNVTDQVGLQAMENSGDKAVKEKLISFQLEQSTDAEGKGTYSVKDMDPETAKKLAAVPGMAQAMGVDTTNLKPEEVEKKIAEAAKTGEGARAMMGQLDLEGYGTATGNVKGADGKIDSRKLNVKAADHESVAKQAAGVMEKANEEIDKRMHVDTKKDPFARQRKFQNDPNERARILTSGTDQEKEDLKAVEKQDPEVAKQQIDRELAMHEEKVKHLGGRGLGEKLVDFLFGGNQDEKELAKLKEHKVEMQGGDKGGQGDMIGKVTMVCDEGFVANLWKAKGRPQ